MIGDSFRQHVDELLQGHTTLTLATWTPEGPQAAPLFFAHTWLDLDDDHERLLLFFISNPESDHAQALQQQPAVAAAIYQDGQDWQMIRGLQMEGLARVLDSEAERRQALTAYSAKYPFVAPGLMQRDGGPIELDGPLARSRFFVIEVDWIRLIDNTRGFGHREEVTL